ncbi:MAG: hypothetical protein PUD93_07475 [Lachnospiraceae bacterium]|nr:hypothetical protein [Lachnospiraceae bacterium]
MNIMDTIITIAVFAVFGFVVYTKKIAPLLKKNREEKGKAEDEKLLPAVSNGNDAINDGSRNPHKKRTYFEVLAFNPKEAENSVFFRERVDLHLTSATNELNEKGIDYDYHFFPLGEMLVVILSYQL